jgi:hypothetical protein
MKPLQNPIVVGVLVVAALALIFRNSFGPLRERFRTKQTQAVSTSPPAFVVESQTNAASAASETNAPEREVGWRRLETNHVNFLALPKRDPFQFVPLPDSYRIVALSNAPSLTDKVKTAQEMLALNAVWMQTGSQLAVLNGQIVTAGSSILDYKVEKIEQDKVWVNGPIGPEKVEFSAGTNAPSTNSFYLGIPERKTGNPSAKN